MVPSSAFLLLLAVCHNVSPLLAFSPPCALTAPSRTHLLPLFQQPLSDNDVSLSDNDVSLSDNDVALSSSFADSFLSSLSTEKKLELSLLAVWAISLSAFILINNSYGPFPLFFKTVPERVFFLSHMIAGMFFGGGIILTTLIERQVALSNDPKVLQFWFDKVPILDSLVVVPALTVSMVSGTGLSIVRYGGLNIAPPHVDAIFWTLILFMLWWATTDLTTQGMAIEETKLAMNDYYQQVEQQQQQQQQQRLGKWGKTKMVDQQQEVVFRTPKVVLDRHFSNCVSCFLVLVLYSMMVLKPGTLFPWPWSHWT